MESKWQTIPLRSRRVRGLCALLGLVLTTLSVAPAARAVDIVNRATAQGTLPSLAQPITLTSDAVTTRVETPTGLPFRLTQQVSPATAQPGQEVLFTLTAARLTNSVALPFAVNVNNQPQALLLVQAVIPVNTSLARVEDGSAGLALFHVEAIPSKIMPPRHRWN